MAGTVAVAHTEVHAVVGGGVAWMASEERLVAT